MGTDELFPGHAYGGNWTNFKRMTLNGAYLGEKGYRGDLTREFAIDPIYGLIYAPDAMNFETSYLESGSRIKWHDTHARNPTAIAGIGRPDDPLGSVFFVGSQGSSCPNVFAKAGPNGGNQPNLLLELLSTIDAELAIDIINHRLYTMMSLLPPVSMISSLWTLTVVIG